MCRRLSACAIFAVVAALPLTARSQSRGVNRTHREEAAYWTSRAEGLDRVVRLLDAEVKARDEVQQRQRSSLAVDSLTVGRFRVVTRGLPTSLVVPLLRSADSVWQASWASPLPWHASATMEFAPVANNPSMMEASVYWKDPGDGVAHARSGQIWRAPAARQIARFDVLRLVDLAIAPWNPERDRRFASRTIGRFPSAGIDTITLAKSAYEELATSPYISGRSCLGGSIGACRQMLGFVEFAPPYDNVLDAAGRAAMLGDGSTRDWPVPYEDRKACVETVDETLCRRAFADVPPLLLEEHLASDGRRLLALQLTRHAAMTGRLNEFTAMLAGNDTEARVAIGTDSLDAAISAWRADILASRPHRILPTGTLSYGVLVLVLGFAGAGLRSSRWRIS